MEYYMPKYVIEEGMIEKFVDLLVRSAVTKKKPRQLIQMISKDRELSSAFGDLEKATDGIKKWASQRRKEDPEYDIFYQHFTDLLRK